MQRESALKTQPSLFITKQSKRRSHTQFGIQTTSNRFGDKSLRSRIKRRSLLTKPEEVNIPVQSQSQINKIQNVNQARVWRQKWQKSESKYQRVMVQIQAIGENYKLTRNGKRMGEKLIELINEITCEGKLVSKPVEKKLQLNQLL